MMMMVKRFAAAALVAGVLATGCVNQNTWTPTVDTYGDPNAWRLSQDEAQCRQLAISVSGSSTRKTAEGTGIGALLGAAAGAAIGAAAHDPGVGAAIGAAVGGAGGGGYEAYESNTAFKRAYELCLRERGHEVLN
jgi:outer membrane lipoprotein SlyB